MYQYKDHLGNIRLSYGYDQKAEVLKIIEENHYYPFGLKHTRYNTGGKKYEPDALNPELMKIKPLPAGETVMNKNKYNGKEYQDELGLNMYDYGARNYDPAIGRWMNIDPLAERHPEISLFVYCANNPVVFVDPDGQDWRINYTDGDGNKRTFMYTGGATALPDNQFVKDFVAAYQYNVENGGGDSMKAIAENSDIIVDVQQTNGESKQESQQSPLGSYNVVSWNPNGGVETTNGTILSPATVLEHESVHGLRSALDPKGAKRETEKPDSQYDTKAEKIAVAGEQKTAIANKEIRIPQVTRDNHKGQTVITTSPTSTTIDRKKTYNYLNNLLQHGTISSGFGGEDVKKYKQ